LWYLRHMRSRTSGCSARKTRSSSSHSVPGCGCQSGGQGGIRSRPPLRRRSSARSTVTFASCARPRGRLTESDSLELLSDSVPRGFPRVLAFGVRGGFSSESCARGATRRSCGGHQPTCVPSPWGRGYLDRHELGANPPAATPRPSPVACKSGSRSAEAAGFRLSRAVRAVVVISTWEPKSGRIGASLVGFRH
jgi:hypothetical protein